METIKIADVYVKFRPDEVELELPTGCNHTVFMPQQALQLAAALTKRYDGGGEWVSVDVKPRKSWLYKLKGADYPYGIWNNEQGVFWHPTITKLLKPTHYQIIQP